MKKYAVCLLVMLPTAALAHAGDHGHFDLAALIAHLFEPDHLFFAAVTIIASILAYRAGRETRRFLHGLAEVARRRGGG